MQESSSILSNLSPIEFPHSPSHFQGGRVAFKSPSEIKDNEKKRASTTLPSKKRKIGSLLMRTVGGLKGELLDCLDNNKLLQIERMQNKVENKSPFDRMSKFEFRVMDVSKVNFGEDENRSKEFFNSANQISFSNEQILNEQAIIRTKSPQKGQFQSLKEVGQQVRQKLIIENKNLSENYSSSVSIRQKGRSNKIISTFSSNTLQNQNIEISQQTQGLSSLQRTWQILNGGDNSKLEENRKDLFKIKEDNQQKQQYQRESSLKETRQFSKSKYDQSTNEIQMSDKEISKTNTNITKKLSPSISQNPSGISPFNSTMRMFTIISKSNPIKKQEQEIVTSSSVSRMAICEEDIKQSELITDKADNFKDILPFQKQREESPKEFIRLDQKQNEIQFENERDAELFHNKKSIRFMNLNFLGKQLALNNKTSLRGILNKKKDTKYDPEVYAKFKQVMKNNRLQVLMASVENEQNVLPLQKSAKNSSQPLESSKEHFSQNQLKQSGQPYFQMENRSESPQKWRYNMNVEAKNVNDHTSENKTSVFAKFLQQQMNYEEESSIQIPFSSRNYLETLYEARYGITSKNDIGNAAKEKRQLSATTSVLRIESPLKLKKTYLGSSRAAYRENKQISIEKINFEAENEVSLSSELTKQVRVNLSLYMPRRIQKSQNQNTEMAINSLFPQQQQLSSQFTPSQIASVKQKFTENGIDEIAYFLGGAKQYLSLLFEIDFSFKSILSEIELTKEQFLQRFFLFLFHSLGSKANNIENNSEQQLINKNSSFQFISSETSKKIQKDIKGSFDLNANLNPKSEIGYTTQGMAMKIGLFSDLLMSEQSQQTILDALKNGLLIAGGKEETANYFINLIKSKMVKQLKQKNLINELGGEPNLRRFFCKVLEHMDEKCNTTILKGASQEEQQQKVESLIQIIIQTGQERISLNNKNKKIPNISEFNNQKKPSEPFCLNFVQFFYLKLSIQCIGQRHGISSKLSCRLLERIEKLRYLISEKQYTKKMSFLKDFQFIRQNANLVNKYFCLKYNSPSERLLIMESFCEFSRGETSLNQFMEFISKKVTSVNNSDVWENLKLFAETIFREEGMKTLLSQIKYKLTILSFKNYQLNKHSSIHKESQKVHDPEVKTDKNHQRFSDSNHQTYFFDNQTTSLGQSIQDFSQNIKILNSTHQSSIESNRNELPSSQNKINGMNQTSSFPIILSTTSERELFWNNLRLKIEEKQEKQKIQKVNSSVKKIIGDIKEKIDNQNGISFQCKTHFDKLSILKYLLDFSISPFEVFSLFDVEAAFTQFFITKDNLLSWTETISEYLTQLGWTQNDIDKQSTFLELLWKVN